MTEGLGKLCGTIKPDNDQIWNDSGMIEDSAGSFESQIGDQQIALIYNNWEFSTVGLF